MTEEPAVSVRHQARAAFRPPLSFRHPPILTVRVDCSDPTLAAGPIEPRLIVDWFGSSASIRAMRRHVRCSPNPRRIAASH